MQYRCTWGHPQLCFFRNDEKFNKDCVKIKLRRDPISEKSYLYEYKMVLFDNGELEELLFFVRNFQMTLKSSLTITDGANIRYLHALVRVKALRQLGTLSIIDVVPDKVIWTVNLLYYLNYEPIARTSSTRHLVRIRNVLGQTVSSYGWCNGIPHVVPLFRLSSEQFASRRLSYQR